MPNLSRNAAIKDPHNVSIDAPDVSAYPESKGIAVPSNNNGVHPNPVTMPQLPQSFPT